MEAILAALRQQQQRDLEQLSRFALDFENTVVAVKLGLIPIDGLKVAEIGREMNRRRDWSALERMASR